MVQIPKSIDPRETNGVSGDTSKIGVYAIETDGETKYLEANDPAQADALIHLGYRQADLAETREYVKATEEARKEYSDALRGDALPQDVMSNDRDVAVKLAQDADADSKRAVAGTTAEGIKKESK